jgi:predicted membrane channel-forming protein YqfA (hemolysin III family)
MTEGAGIAHVGLLGFLLARYFAVAKVMASLVFVECPQKRVYLCSIYGLGFLFLCWCARVWRCWLKTRLRLGAMLSGRSHWATHLCR